MSLIVTKCHFIKVKNEDIYLGVFDIMLQEKFVKI